MSEHASQVGAQCKHTCMHKTSLFESFQHLVCI